MLHKKVFHTGNFSIGKYAFEIHNSGTYRLRPFHFFINILYMP